MNKTTLNRAQLDLLVKAVMQAHRRLEDKGKRDTEWVDLRALEDKLGALQGEKFSLEATM